MLGFIMAAYSLAQCFGAPAFGYWSNRIEQVSFLLPIFQESKKVFRLEFH